MTKTVRTEPGGHLSAYVDYPEVQLGVQSILLCSYSALFVGRAGGGGGAVETITAGHYQDPA